MTAGRQQVEESAAAREWDTLTTALNQLGVDHIQPARQTGAGLTLTPADLFRRLARAPDPRLQQAIVFLLLTHPDLARDAQEAFEKLSGEARDRAMRRYVAAAALQCMARTRLRLSLGPQPLIPVPPEYLAELRVPPLDQEFGRETLLKLAADEDTRYGYPAWRTYQTILFLFLNESRRQSWGRSRAATG